MALTKKTKRLWKKFYKNREGRRAKGDTLRHSLNEKARVRWDEGGEGGREYGIEFMDGWTDEEINEYFDSQREEIHSIYDCTGRPFTRWIDWHRNPDGSVSYVHQLELDY